MGVCLFLLPFSCFLFAFDAGLDDGQGGWYPTGGGGGGGRAGDCCGGQGGRGEHGDQMSEVVVVALPSTVITHKVELLHSS